MYLKKIVAFSAIAVLLTGCMGSSSDDKLISDPRLLIEQQNINGTNTFFPYLVVSASEPLASVTVRAVDGEMSLFVMHPISEARNHIFESTPISCTQEQLSHNYDITLVTTKDKKAEDKLSVNVGDQYLLGDFVVNEFKMELDYIRASFEPVDNATHYGLLISYSKDILGNPISRINDRIFAEENALIEGNKYEIESSSFLQDISAGVEVKVSVIAINDQHNLLYRVGATKTIIRGNNHFEEDGPPAL